MCVLLQPFSLFLDKNFIVRFFLFETSYNFSLFRYQNGNKANMLCSRAVNVSFLLLLPISFLDHLNKKEILDTYFTLWWWFWFTAIVDRSQSGQIKTVAHIYIQKNPYVQRTIQYQSCWRNHFSSINYLFLCIFVFHKVNLFWLLQYPIADSESVLNFFFSWYFSMIVVVALQKGTNKITHTRSHTQALNSDYVFI